MRMKMRLVLLATVSVLLVGVLLSGCQGAEAKEPLAMEPSIEDRLEPVHPDEPVSHTFNTRFEIQNALMRLSTVRDLSGEQTGEAAMAFNNAVGAIEGTLRKQAYEIAKLDFELAKALFRDGEIDENELNQKKAAYESAVLDFTTFWESFGISD